MFAYTLIFKKLKLKGKETINAELAIKVRSNYIDFLATVADKSSHSVCI